MDGGASWGCAHARTGRAPALTADAQGGRTQVCFLVLQAPSLPQASLGASAGPRRGGWRVGECDPPSVRKPSLAIREACLGVPDPPDCRLCLCLRDGSAAVATRSQRTLLPFPLDGVRGGERGFPPATAVVAERGSSPTVARASPF